MLAPLQAKARPPSYGQWILVLSGEKKTLKIVKLNTENPATVLVFFCMETMLILHKNVLSHLYDYFSLYIRFVLIALTN